MAPGCRVLLDSGSSLSYRTPQIAARESEPAIGWEFNSLCLTSSRPNKDGLIPRETAREKAGHRRQYRHETVSDRVQRFDRIGVGEFLRFAGRDRDRP